MSLPENIDHTQPASLSAPITVPAEPLHIVNAPPPPPAPPDSAYGPKRGTGLMIYAAVFLFAVILVIAYVVVAHKRAAREEAIDKASQLNAHAASPVDVVRIEPASDTHTITKPGETRAWFETTVYARVSGYLKEWKVDIGDHVKAGQVLAIIDTPEIDQQLAAATAKVSADEAQINLAKANVHFAEVTLARYKGALKGVVSDVERDQHAADYQTSIARQQAAEADRASSEADVNRLNALSQFKIVTAPFDGVITDRRVDIGDLVTAGSTSSTTSLFKLAQYNKIRVFTYLPQSLVAEVRDGSHATALLNGRKYPGLVARNARALDPVTKMLRVEVDIPNDSLEILPGMYLDVLFTVKDDHPALEIPASALNFRTGGPQVALVGDDGAVTFKDVSISRDLGPIVEIAGDIHPNDRVALNISNQINDGDKVTPTETSASGTLVSTASAAPAHPPTPVH